MIIGAGSILFLAGLALAAWQWQAVAAFLLGAIPLLFLLVGALVFLIGYSQRKAKRFFKENVENPPRGNS